MLFLLLLLLLLPTSETGFDVMVLVHDRRLVAKPNIPAEKVEYGGLD